MPVTVDAKVMHLVEGQQCENEERAYGCVTPAVVVYTACVVDCLECCTILRRPHPRQVDHFKAAGRKGGKCSVSYYASSSRTAVCQCKSKTVRPTVMPMPLRPVGHNRLTHA